jgi:CheY-like chemotaxis protein
MPSTIEIVQHVESQSLVMADATQIHQIIMNLCTNAYHAMHDKGGTLIVGLNDVRISKSRKIDDSTLLPGNYIRLEVSDTGCGISDDIKGKIFEPYFTTKGHGEGTGLGLSVVFGIVESHCGCINVQSEKGKGTTFQIYLPIIDRKAGKALHPDEQEEVLIGGSETIMFVDDEEDITDLGGSILGKYGYDVSVFSSGKAALEELNNNPGKYDLIITDMTMPQMTGLELAEQILQLYPDKPIIISSGHSDKLDRETALSMGIKEYCEKPINTKDLLHTVRMVLDRKKIKG